MKQSSSYWDNRAINRLIDSEKISNEYIKRIQKMYARAYKNIEKELESIYRNYANEVGLDVQTLKEKLTKAQTNKIWKELDEKGLDDYVRNNYKSRISRLEQIQAQIYAKAKEIYSEEELEQRMCYEGVINHSYYKTIYDVQMGTGYDFPFNKIDDSLVNSLLNERWSGKNYSERIWANTDILANSVSEIVGGALLSGQSVEKTSKQIRDRFNVSKYYSDRLVRTETSYFNNQVDLIAYEKLGVDEYVFVAVLDNRTCDKCGNHDKKVYKTKDKQQGVNAPPFHPNCRCKTRGHLDEESEKRLKRRARNPITGKTEIVDNISYNEWAKKHGLIKPKTIVDTDTSLKRQLGFYDNTGTLTFIPEKSIISNTKVIAGPDVKSKFRNAKKYSEVYGGDETDYSKIAGKIESDKYIFDIHFIKDNKGNEYDFKIKNKTLRGEKNDRKS